MPTSLVPTTSPVPCPPWCRHVRGHGLRTLDGVVRRVHLSPQVSVPGAGLVELEQLDTVGVDGAVTAGEVHVVTGACRMRARDLVVALHGAVVVA